jgi:hypothetical protein
MRLRTRPVALLIVLAALAAPAAAKAPAVPHVTFSGWTVYSASGAKTVKAGATLTACHKPTELLAKGRVVRAVRHQSYVETWRKNGRKTDRFVISWAGKGSYADSWSLSSAAGFANGRWNLKLTRGTRTIGTESITLRCAG